MHFAKELWIDYTDLALHRRLITALQEQHGHRMLSQVEAAKIACSISGDAAKAALQGVDAVYLTGGSSALRTLIEALRVAMPHATLVEGNRFGGVAAGLAWAGKVQGF